MTTIGDLIHYEADADALAGLTDEQKEKFVAWMEKLDVEHKRLGSPYGNVTLWQATGAECWLSWFLDGDDPADALAEDLSNAD